jgi:hypothetical protein
VIVIHRRVGWVTIGLVAVTMLVLGAPALPGAAAADAPSQCVTCHLDAAKLKLLTPPDPPPSEAGEG